MKQSSTRAVLVEVAIHFVLLVAVCAALYPILWVVSLALAPSGAPDARALPIPDSISFHSFASVLFRQNSSGTWVFAVQLFNSVVISLATSFVAVAIATPASYALARFRFVGSKAGTSLLLFTQMFPGVAASVPLYLLLDSLHLLDTRSGLILVYATSAVPFAIFQLRSAFEAIPREIEEAAMVDGATQFGAFLRVALPAARPALAVTGLFAFMTAWNEFILAATFLSREEMFTVPLLLNSYVSEYSAAWGNFAAGAILVSIPVCVLFYALQRQLAGGLTSGSVKG
ncbi:MAG: ABC transporter permease subunit [Sandaracinaceae bacterium]|nr:ABC transporter permease subunit [Sandaracinaceae bacterium]